MMNARVDFHLTHSLFDRKYEQIETRFDPEFGIAWSYMNPTGAPCFNFGMLEELRAHEGAIEASGGRLLYHGDVHQVHYIVIASKVDDVFSLGGNLTKIVPLIQARDRDTLMKYAKLCIDNMHSRICSYHGPITTISLVQGEALGGGFETALASNVIIAEKRARMGLPEILFNLFPGMGAYSLLSRRVGMKRAEEMISSGQIYTAAQLHEMGVVDVVVEDGTGENALYDYVRRNERRRNGMQAMFSCRQQVDPIAYDEMLNITSIWVEAALRLDERDIKLMSRLGRSQLKRAQNQPAVAPTVEVRFATA
jgi:DSF synthase